MDASLPAMDVLNSAAMRLGYESLREEQAAVVHAFVEGNDVFASLETISSLTVHESSSQGLPGLG